MNLDFGIRPDNDRLVTPRKKLTWGGRRQINGIVETLLEKAADRAVKKEERTDGLWE